MRTTLNLDDDVFHEAKNLSELQGKSLSRVVSELARRGLRAASGETSFPTFQVSQNAKPLTLEMVLEALDEV